MPQWIEQFRPSWFSSVLLGGLVLAFLWLGNWQLQRAAQKDELQRQFSAAPAFGTLPEPGQAVRFARVSVAGRFDPDRHVLADNQVYLGRAGVHALSPFQLEDGRALLVNRGWLPLPPDRRTLPPVPTEPAPTTVTGLLDKLALPGRRLGEPDQLQRDHWPQLATYPDLSAIESALGLDLYPYVLLLDAGHPAGFGDRGWRPVQTGANKHRARALQWFTFVAATLIIWLVLGARRGRQPWG